ncbi:aspartate/glutamate racemase family protein [Peptoniphilus catoniae]|uniref:aspartate/glutamate racemase family protein n=1 Tax=Peptoniphilus catoniae TaxID=1660341 RepID=UPI0010FE79CE|nr:aspartate/glutamate racemase family protein [Peptoniphilus catoniae]
MKALLINPNSDLKVTEDLKNIVDRYETKYVDLDVIGTVNTPKLIITKEDIEDTYDELAKIIKEQEDTYDIFIIACHLDPNLKELRKITEKIVLGICEVSVLFAKMLGKSFSIIGASKDTVNMKHELVKSYGADDSLDRVSYIEKTKDSLKDNLYDAADKIEFNNKSDSIILGCAGFSHLDGYLEKSLQRDVIDGVALSILLSDTYARYKELK